MTTLIAILGLLLALVGLVGCILPLVPGPPLCFGALVILSFAKNWEPFSLTFLIVTGGLTVAVSVLDFVVPPVAAKRYGASKIGVWGSIIGIILGFFLFPPWGMFFGAFAGALAGELLVRKEGKEVLRAGWGVFVGTMVGIGLKLALCGVMVFFYVREMF